MDKIKALIETNKLLSRKIKTLNNQLSNDDFNADLIFTSNNSETSFNIYHIKKNQTSGIFNDDDFQRIINIKGKIKIILLDYKEETILSSLNTILIPPKTNYKVQSIEDTEVIVIFKAQKEKNENLLTNETIYNKLYYQYE